MSDQPVSILYTDEDVDGDGIRLARRLGAEVVTAKNAGLLGADDSVHFAYAVERGYVMVTGNIRDYAPLLKNWQAGGQAHPGMIYITSRHAKNSYLIAEWLTLYTYEPMQNREEWI